MRISYKPTVYPSKQANNQNIQPACIKKSQFQNIIPKNQVRFAGFWDKLFKTLDEKFAKPATFEDLIKDAKLAHNNNRPLIDAIRRGDYEGMEERGIELLQNEREKAQWTGVRQTFDEAIRRLKEKDYDWKKDQSSSKKLESQKPVSFTGLTDLLSGLFKKKPPLEELKELAKLAHRNSRPLFLMVNHGELAGLENKAIEILKAERNKAKYTAIKEDFDSIIDILTKKDYYKG